MSKNKFNHAWLHDHINDPYVKQARQEGYRARAAYKLKEIDEQDKLIHPGQIIVDLGATPGSWSQYLSRRLTMPHPKEKNQNDVTESKSTHDIKGKIIALDMIPMEPIAHVQFIEGDFREESVLKQLELILSGAQLDIVLSDMAPNLSGVASADAARMADLAELALEFALKHLKPEGALLIKCFHGSGYSQIVSNFKRYFKIVAPRKPKASRGKSSETFLLGRMLKK